MESRAGQLLIASPRLLDPNFRQTVTLLIEHGESGALGLVINRPTQTLMSEAWAASNAEGPCYHEGWIFQGGPCEGPLMAVHTHADHAQFSPAPGVQVTADKDDLEWLMEHNEGPMKCFIGYAGWGPGQLESELDTASWLLTHARAERVFDNHERLWLELLRDVDPAQALLEMNPRLRPSDPTMN